MLLENLSDEDDVDGLDRGCAVTYTMY